jgi:hypothetical protein
VGVSSEASPVEGGEIGVRRRRKGGVPGNWRLDREVKGCDRVGIYVYDVSLWKEESWSTKWKHRTWQ